MELTIEQVLQQGITVHKEGKLQEAERLYRVILQNQPLHPDANHNLGVLAVSVSRVKDALPLFKIALDSNPQIEQFWLSYIDALIKERQIEKAREIIEEGKKQGVFGEKLNALETQLLYLIQKPAPEKSGPSPQQINSLFDHYEAGRLSDAEQLALLFTKEYPKHQLGWKMLGAIFSETGRLEEALNAKQRVVELSPQEGEAHSSLGITLKLLGRLEEAEASYRRAVAFKPDFAVAYNNLGNLLQSLGRLEDSEISYKQAIELNPDYVEAYNNLGLTLSSLQRYEEAVSIYDRAIKIKSNFAEAYNSLGATLKELGRYQEAELNYRQAIKNAPNMGSPYLGLAKVLIQREEPEEAYALHTKGLKLTSTGIISNSNLDKVVPKFVNKLQQQNGIATFFDNYVNMQLQQKPHSSDDFCRIFEDGQLSKDNRFVPFSQRVKAIQNSTPSGRLFGGIPFSSSQGIHSLIKWKDHSLYKTTFDLVLYWMIMQEVRPDIIIELGSGTGGSAIWIADMARASGLNTYVYSYDISTPKLNHERVTFIEYDLKDLNKKSKPPSWQHFEGKKIVIEDAHVNLRNVLDLFDTILKKDDYLIIEDSDSKQKIISDFVKGKEQKYKLDQFFLDFFGTNITCSMNSIFKVF